MEDFTEEQAKEYLRRGSSIFRYNLRRDGGETIQWRLNEDQIKDVVEKIGTRIGHLKYALEFIHKWAEEEWEENQGRLLNGTNVPDSIVEFVMDDMHLDNVLQVHEALSPLKQSWDFKIILYQMAVQGFGKEFHHIYWASSKFKCTPFDEDSVIARLLDNNVLTWDLERGMIKINNKVYFEAYSQQC
jgi:type I site-specific restriction endonuclease